MSEQAEMEELLRRFYCSAELLFFLKQVFRDEQWRRFWLRHPEDFLGTIPDVGATPYLHYNTAIQREPQQRKELESQVIDSGELTDTHKTSTLTRMKPLFDAHMPTLQRVGLEALLVFWKSNPAYQQLLEGDVTPERIKESIGRNPPNFEQLMDWFEETAEAFGGAAKQLAPELVDRSADFARAAASFVPPSFYFFAWPEIRRLLEDGELEPDWYGQMLDRLATAGVVEAQSGSAFICPSCGPKSLVSAASPLTPRQLARLQCLHCTQAMVGMTLYRLHDGLRDAILSRDGLLNFLFMHVLRKSNVDHETFVKPGATEVDAILKNTPEGTLLVEVKVHRIPEGARSADGRLTKDANQTLKHKDALEQKGTKVDACYVLQNLPVNKPIEHRGVRFVDFDAVLNGRLFLVDPSSLEFPDL